MFLFNQFKILSHNFQELARSNDFCSGQAQEAIKCKTELTELVGEISASVTKVCNENARLCAENTELQEKLLKLQNATKEETIYNFVLVNM